MLEDYVIRVESSPVAVSAQAWDALLDCQAAPSPFMRHAYLAALEASGSACARTGWTSQWITLHRLAGAASTVPPLLQAACVVYTKTHSYGEYVFDWAWANAYEQHGLSYYPKAVVAVPFTPVPGSRLLAVDCAARQALVEALLQWCEATQQSSLHVLFADENDMAACEAVGMMRRHTVQFHWTNVAPTLPATRGALPPEGAQVALGRPGGDSVAPTLPATRGALPPEGAQVALWRPGGDSVAPTLPATANSFASFEDFLTSLSQDKRKKIRQERRKVAEAGVSFRCVEGANITAADWDFFYRCYERTYLEHGNAPYLTRDFFKRMADTLANAWVMFIAMHSGRQIAISLIAVSASAIWPTGQFASKTVLKNTWQGGVAYGRYWGALERVDCLHFEACYYQPLEWCIAHGLHRFEGGAQGEHKMARALLPVMTHSAHWLQHPAFSDAVARFLEREGEGVQHYLGDLNQRNPFKQR